MGSDKVRGHNRTAGGDRQSFTPAGTVAMLRQACGIADLDPGGARLMRLGRRMHPDQHRVCNLADTGQTPAAVDE